MTDPQPAIESSRRISTHVSVRVSAVAIFETTDPNTYNSCNGYPLQLSSTCTTTQRPGNFTDTPSVGCPASAQIAAQGCGYTVTDQKWEWCGLSYVSIGDIFNYISVGGNSSGFTPGTPFHMRRCVKMRVIDATLFLLACVVAEPMRAIPLDVLVSGHVYDRMGAPVRHARVVFWSYAGTAAIQPITESDKAGAYTLDISGLSAGAVSASKEDEGYPDAVLAFYGRSGYQSFQAIDSKFFVLGRSLDLRFGEPQTTIAWTVVDSGSGEPVRGARANLQTVSNREIAGSRTVPERGEFVFVLPRDPINIRMSASGYADQTFVEQDHAGAVHSGVFSLSRRTIRLRRLSK